MFLNLDDLHTLAERGIDPMSYKIYSDSKIKQMTAKEMFEMFRSINAPQDACPKKQPKTLEEALNEIIFLKSQLTDAKEYIEELQEDVQELESEVTALEERTKLGTPQFPESFYKYNKSDMLFPKTHNDIQKMINEISNGTLEENEFILNQSGNVVVIRMNVAGNNLTLVTEDYYEYVVDND